MEETITLRKYSEADLESMLDIFNYFAQNSFAVYCDFPLLPDQFRKVVEQMRVALILEAGDKIIGFGYISSYKPFPNFKNTGVLTYFILPEYTGRGYGTKLFETLISEGIQAGITNYLAHISSKNNQSLSFHKKHGFEEVGIFKNVAYKFNDSFDIVWMQKQYNNQ